MNTAQMIAALDGEIARLEQVKKLLTREQKAIPFLRPKRHLSAEARQRISDGQRRRWARVLSAEARQRISDGQRRRWARVKRAA